METEREEEERSGVRRARIMRRFGFSHLVVVGTGTEPSTAAMNSIQMLKLPPGAKTKIHAQSRVLLRHFCPMQCEAPSLRDKNEGKFGARGRTYHGDGGIGKNGM
jgi:hypothetical protein